MRRENDVLKTDNVQLKTGNDAMKAEILQLKANDNKQKDEIKQLTALLDKMAANNGNQIQQINSQSSEIETMRDENKQLKTEIQQLKVRDHIGFTYISYTSQLPSHILSNMKTFTR